MWKILVKAYNVYIRYVFMYSSGWTLWMCRWTADLSSKGRWEASRPVCTQGPLPSHPLLCRGSSTTDVQVSHQHLSTSSGCPKSININPYLVTHYRNGILTEEINDAQKMCQRYSYLKLSWPKFDKVPFQALFTYAPESLNGIIVCTLLSRLKQGGSQNGLTIQILSCPQELGLKNAWAGSNLRAKFDKFCPEKSTWLSHHWSIGIIINDSFWGISSIW